VFQELEKQTGYSFLYENKLLEKANKVTISLKNASLQQVLEECFKNQPLSYKIFNNTVVVAEKNPIPNEDDHSLTTDDSRLTIDITGKVTDADGNPLAGATVKVKGTSKGTTTNNDGVFVLKDVDDNATLEISFVGYETYRVSLSPAGGGGLKAGGGLGTIALKIKPESLNEVVINKGYYTTSQQLNTGNVSRVTAKDIEKQPVNNPLLALQGRVPGMIITQQTGVPGSSVMVQIRGLNSLEKSKAPLYVVDGVPYISSNPYNLGGDIFGSSGFGGDYGGSPLSYINSADIESIDVLKDADATAIYGSRGANGVVLITTKKGKAGKMKVDVDLQTGLGQVGKKIKLLNTQQFLAMRREAFINDGSAVPVRNPNATYDYDLALWDTTRYTDWQKELIGGTAHYNQAQVSLSGGNRNTSFLFSGTYHKETTVFPADLSDKQGAVHFNLNSLSNNQKFRFNLTTTYNVIDNRLVKADLTKYAISIAPNAPQLFNADGSINWAPNSAGVGSWNNPIAFLTNSRYHSQSNNLIANSILSYEIINGLEVKTSFGYNNLQLNDVTTDPSSTKDPARWNNYGNSLRQSKFSNNRSISWIVEPQIAYSHNISNGNFSALLGSTIQERKTSGQVTNAQGFASDLLIEDPSSASSISTSINYSQYKYAAVFGRISYDWDQKYVLNLTARRDGTSRFGPANRFHNFEAIGLGWVFSKEKAIDKNLKFLSFGKIRGSYGTTGNDGVGDYSFLDLYSSTNAGAPYQGLQGLQLTSPYTPDLAWEETKKLEFALDLGLFNDRIFITASRYLNKSSNQLISSRLPYITGFSNINQNLDAVIKNDGWEFTLNTTNFDRKNFHWSSSFNIFWNKNELTKIDSSNLTWIKYKGHSLTTTFVYKFAGVNPSTGVYEFLDSKGNIISAPNNPKDNFVPIELNPKFSGGLTNTIQFKEFQLDFLLHFVKQTGQDFLYTGEPGYADNINWGNQPTTVLRRWQKPGDVTNIQKFEQSGALYQRISNALNSDQLYTDISYIKLKNVSLSWQIPDRWEKSAHLQSCRIYVQGQNLLTFSKFNGFDPETRFATSLPPLRVITAGIRVGL
jgi:TonB-linked SusC/RagA family outer membrane protein